MTPIEKTRLLEGILKQQAEIEQILVMTVKLYCDLTGNDYKAELADAYRRVSLKQMEIHAVTLSEH